MHELISVSLEIVGALLEKYYDNLSDSDGDYSISYDESYDKGEDYLYIVRYVASEEETAEITAYGGNVTANKLVSNVYVNKKTGFVSDDYGKTWNLW